jgi:hypothetical protein
MEKYETFINTKVNYDKIIDRVLIDIEAKDKYPHLLKLLKQSKPSEITPLDFKFMLDDLSPTDFTLYLNTDIAVKIRDILKTKLGDDKYREDAYPHIICSRVLDYWNLEDFGGYGYCYYGNWGEIKFYKDKKKGIESILEYKYSSSFKRESKLSDSDINNLKHYLCGLDCIYCKNNKCELIPNRTCKECHFEKIKLLYLYTKDMKMMDKNVLQIIINYSLQ